MKSSYLLLLFSFLFTATGYFSEQISTLRVGALLVFFYCVIKGFKERYIINPYFLFSITPVTLLIYFQVHDFYMMNLTPATWSLAIFNMIAFLLGVSITNDFSNYKNCKDIGDYDNQKTRRIFFIVVLGLLPSFYFRITGTLMPLASVFNILATVGFVCAMCIKKLKLILLVLGLQSLPFIIGGGSKSGLLLVCFAFLVAYEKKYVQTLFDRKKLIALCIGGILLMFAGFSFANKERGSYNAEVGLEYYERVGFSWNYDASLFMPYMYLTTPWSNLQYVTQTQSDHTYGLWMAKPILGYFQLDSYFENEYKLKPYSSFNTYSFVAVEYKDFGFWGSLIISFLLGFFVKKVYSRYKVSASSLDIACFAITSQAILEMFFSNHFFQLSYPFTVVILMEILKKIYSSNNSKIDLNNLYDKKF